MLEESNESQVFLQGLTRESSGLYECQVSTEGPHFHTASDKDYMLVVVPPLTSPTISGLRGLYAAGDYVRVNCTSAPSQPAANLSWIVNGQPAKEKWVIDLGQTFLSEDFLEGIESEQKLFGLAYSSLALNLPANIDTFPGRVLSLRCVAVLGAREWNAQRWTILHQGSTRYPGTSTTTYSSKLLLFTIVVFLQIS